MCREFVSALKIRKSQNDVRCSFWSVPIRGVDSSTNVALMSRLMDRPVDSFTVGFKDYEHLNELEYANQIAKFNTNHHQVLIDESDMVGYLEQLIHHQDEPIADWVCILSISYPN